MDFSHLAEYFKQEKFSDTDLLVLLNQEPEGPAPDEAEPQAERPRHAAAKGKVLARFPAHRVLLVGTDYFKAQTEKWVPAAVDLAVTKAAADSAAAAACSRPQLRLTLDSAEQLPAAEAVIAALYGVPDAITFLEPAQQVAAAVLADRLGAAAVAQQAVQVLNTAGEAEQGLPAAALEALASLSAWPACLHPLLLPVLKTAPCCADGLVELADIAAADNSSRAQRMLLAVLGNLEAVWRDQQLQELLLQLPLPAMQLLLSSDSLCVASEDTVVYTASKYADEVNLLAATSIAALAAVVRAPHLSGSILAGQVLSSSSSTMLLAGYSEQLKQLASYKLAARGAPVPAKVLSGMIAVPAAWMLGQRKLTTADPVVAAASGGDSTSLQRQCSREQVGSH